MIIPPVLKPVNIERFLENANKLYVQDLGYANGWKDTPDIVKKCHEMGHIQNGRNVGRCLHEYGCGACKYKYLVDSSD